MELKEAIEKRRSTRAFASRAIDPRQIEEMIAAAICAPSACNRRAWKFIVIDRHELQQRIVDAGGAQFIKNARAGILVLYDNRTDNLEYRDHIQSAAAAVQNMLLTATSMGIGSCWVCQLPYKAALRALLTIPPHYDPIAYVALGYPAAPVASGRPRTQTPREVIAWNAFDFEEAAPPPALRLKLRIAAKGIYFRLPVALKRMLRPLAERFVRKFD